MHYVNLARGRRWLWTLALATAAALVVAVGAFGLARPAAAAAYVGAELGDVKPADKAVVANPQPVQIIFEFRTKGAPNAQATKFAKDKVIQFVRDTGVFSEVSEQPTPNGAILSVVIDNAVDAEAMNEAKMQGAVTGATLFIAGSNVRDDYVATIEYVAGPGAAPIKRKATHFIITQIGLINSTPEGAVKVGKTVDAFFMMARQIVTNPLNDIARDPGFAGAPAGVEGAAPATDPALVAEPAAAGEPAAASEPAAAPAEATAAPAPAPQS